MAVALACSVGLHWSFLQSLAWTTMLVDNLTTTSFPAAVQRTFDGKHPCALCKVIAKGAKSGTRSETLLSLKKFEGLSQAVAVMIPAPGSFPRVAASKVALESLARTPPTPPPRAA
jgi:hypothetical protein